MKMRKPTLTLWMGWFYFQLFKLGSRGFTFGVSGRGLGRRGWTCVAPQAYRLMYWPHPVYGDPQMEMQMNEVHFYIYSRHPEILDLYIYNQR